MSIPDPNFFHPRSPDPGSKLFASWIPDPGSEFFPSRILDPGSASKNLSILTKKNGFSALINMIRFFHPGSGSRIRILTFYPSPVAYPGGMHRMHVHPPSPPCASPPLASPPPQPERLVTSGQQEKNASLFTCDLIIFCRVSLYIKKTVF